MTTATSQKDPMTVFAKKIRLTNGLNVIFEKNSNANVVSVNIGVKVGSVDEGPDESGICHLIEHMVFKGTKSFAAGEIATLVEAHGGELNAYTSLDQTVYYINIPNRHFGLALKLIKEMVFDAKFDATELEREKEVVVEEIKRGQDNPHRVLGELVFSNFYRKHPYGRPVIGTEELVRGFSREKISSFYKKHYCPQNMILGICGNITEDELSQELEKLFRFEMNTPRHTTSLPREPEKTSFQVLTQAMEIQATYFEISFPAPHFSHEDAPVLDLLSSLLGESETSLLEQNTQRKQQLVHSIYSSCYMPKYPGLFMIGGMVDPKKISEALASIKHEVEQTKIREFETEKVERAKLAAKAQLIYEQQTCEGTARKWITYETSGADYKFDEKYLEDLLKITPADLKKAAEKYLNFGIGTLGVIHPKNVQIKIDKSLFGTPVAAKTRQFKKIAEKNDARIFKLDNGIRVILKENHRLPLVSIKTASLGGLRHETRANNGINQLLSSTITKGTESLSQLALAEKSEWLVASINSYTGRNSFGLSLSTLSEKIHQAVPLFADVALRPAFDPDELAKEKKLQLEAIKNYEDNPSQLAFRIVLEKIFKGHPYELNMLGTTQTVKSFTSNSLKKYYSTIMSPDNLVISVVGDFDSNEILELLNEEFSNLKKKKHKIVKLKKPQALRKIESLTKFKNNKQAHVALGFMATSIYDKDRHAMEIINNILSGQGGRLFLELRDKMSLAYTVSPTLVEGLETGFFGTYIGTEPAKVATAIKAMLKELGKIQNELVSARELERAKNYIIGNHEIDHQKNSSVAMQLALNELYKKGLGEFFDFHVQINKVTSEDIQRVAKKYINLNRYVMGVVGPKP